MFGDKHFGEYILVISSSDEVECHIEDALQMNHFAERPENMRARIIWINKKWTKRENPVHKKWPDILFRRGRLPRNWFLKDPDEPLSQSTPARMELDILKAEEILPLTKIGKQIVSSIIFSDSKDSDAKLTLIIGLLKSLFPQIYIASECTQSELVPYLEEAGADEVFNRKLLLNRAMALSFVSDTKISYFLSRLMQENCNDLGLKSSFLGSVRLLLPHNKIFSIDNHNWELFRSITREEKVKVVALFYRHEFRFSLKPLTFDSNISLRRGDSILLLSPSYENLNKFESRIIDNNLFLKEE